MVFVSGETNNCAPQSNSHRVDFTRSAFATLVSSREYYFVTLLIERPIILVLVLHNVSQPRRNS